MKRVFTIILLLVSYNIYAQITFERVFGGLDQEHTYSVEQTADSGYVICGHTNSFGAGNYDGYLIKTNAAGDTLWIRTYGTYLPEKTHCVKQTSDGGYIIGGYTEAPSTRAYLIKTDSLGNLVWSKCVGDQPAWAFSVAQTSDGGYITAGYTTCCVTQTVPCLIKTDGNGNVVWTKVYYQQPYEGYFYVSTVIITPDDGYLLMGRKTDTSNNPRAFCMRTDVNGNSLWAKTFGGTSPGYPDHFYSALLTNDGGFIFLGSTYSFGAGSEDVFIVKTDSIGNMQWSRTIGNAQSNFGFCIRQCDDGGFVGSGRTQLPINSYNDALIFKIDANGYFLWSRAHGNINIQEQAHSVCKTFDGGFVMAGYIDLDILFIKTDSLGFSSCSYTPEMFMMSVPAVEQSVNLLDTSLISMSSIISQVGSAAFDVNDPCFPTAFNEASKEDILMKFFPNPTTNELTIYSEFFERSTISEIEIYNTLGERVYSQQPETSNSKPVTVNVSQLLPGVYFVAVAGDKGGKLTRKFVKM